MFFVLRFSIKFLKVFGQYGLFARKKLSANTIIGEYTGHVKLYNTEKNSGYLSILYEVNEFFNYKSY